MDGVAFYNGNFSFVLNQINGEKKYVFFNIFFIEDEKLKKQLNYGRSPFFTL